MERLIKMCAYLQYEGYIVPSPLEIAIVKAYDKKVEVMKKEGIDERA